MAHAIAARPAPTNAHFDPTQMEDTAANRPKRSSVLRTSASMAFLFIYRVSVFQSWLDHTPTAPSPSVARGTPRGPGKQARLRYTANRGGLLSLHVRGLLSGFL